MEVLNSICQQIWKTQQLSQDWNISVFNPLIKKGIVKECPHYHTFVPCQMVEWRRQWHPTPVLSPGKFHGWRSLVGYSPWGHEDSNTTERLPFHFHALEKEMATHSSVLEWRIPGMGESGGLPSMGSHRLGQDWRDLEAAEAAAANGRKVMVKILQSRLQQFLNNELPHVPAGFRKM